MIPKPTLSGWTVQFIAAILYMTGLSFLMPFATLLLFPPEVFILPQHIWTITAITAGMVLLSAAILALQKKSLGDAFLSLSLMTFLVGAIAIILIIFGEDKIMGALNFLGALKPAAEGYMEYWKFFLPKAGISLAGYILLAALLFAAGNSIRKQQHKIGWMQRVFGKETKLFKR